MTRLASEAAAFLLLWAACAAFQAPLRRRPHFFLRCVLMLPAAAAAWGCAMLPAGGSEIMEFLLFFVFNYLFCLLFFGVCGRLSLQDVLYCGVWAVVSSQIVQELFMLCFQLLAPRLTWSARGWEILAWCVTAACLFAGCLCAIGFTAARWMPHDGVYDVGPRQLSSALVLLVIFEALYYYVSQALKTELRAGAVFFFVQCYCVTVLYLQHTLFVGSAMRQELQTLNELRQEREKQYEQAKEAIAIINRKCHDLKHQIAALRTVAGPAERERYLREVEDAVQIYDATFKTGNAVLDTVLTEKSMLCVASGITLNCVADGGALTFMDPVDVYTILGNALDNAKEHVSQSPRAEDRCIDVLICRDRGSLVIRLSNPLTGLLTFENGLPRTTKERNGWHGFGLKSIRHTVEKYGGFMTVNAENGCFVLSILIPRQD